MADDTSTDDPDPGAELTKVAETALTIIDTQSEGNYPPMPGLQFLGSGFDALGECHAHSKRANIFDFLTGEQSWREQVFIDRSLAGVEDKAMQAFNSLPNSANLTYKIPQLVDFAPAFEGQADTFQIKTFSDLQTSLGIEAGADAQIGLFSGEFTARFDMKQMQMASTEAYTVFAKMIYARMSMDNYNQSQPAIMRVGVQEDLDGVAKGGRHVLSAEEILDTYGTHYVKRFDLGTMIVLSFTNDTSRNSTKLDLSAALKAHYGAAGEGGGGNVATKMSSDLATNQSSIKQLTRVWGVGDDQLQALNMLTAGRGHSTAAPAVSGEHGTATPAGSAETAAMTPIGVLREGWHNPTLIGVDLADLVPVWSLCRNSKRRADIELAFTQRAAHKAAVLPDGKSRLQPVFRFRRDVGGMASYRLSLGVTSPAVAAGADGAWVENNSGQPVFCLRTNAGDGLVPLYAWNWMGKLDCWRYETASWDGWLDNVYPNNWRKVSSIPVGYVIDGLSLTNTPPGSVPVYAYYPVTADGCPRFYYSIDGSDSADNFGWSLGLGIDRPWDYDPNNATYQQLQRHVKDQTINKFSAKLPHWYAFPIP